jgi:cytochrome P450 family 135
MRATVDQSLPPGPRLPGALQTALLVSARRHLVPRWKRRYGDVFTVRAPGIGKVIYLTDPADIRVVFRGDPAVFHAGPANVILSGVLGPESIFLLDGDRHRRFRSLMMPAFHGDAVRRQVSDMAAITWRELRTWPVGEEFALHPRMRAISLEIIMRTVIGVDDPGRLATLREVLPAMVEVGNPWLAVHPPPLLRSVGPWRRRRLALERADALLFDEIAARRAAPDLAERADVLAMLVRAYDDKGAAMTDDELRDQLVTLLLAGYETTATWLAWTFERLLRNPEVLKRAREAARAGDDAYLDAVGRESLRARPVVYEVGRVTRRPVELAGYRIPPGTLLVPSIESVHTDPRYYPQPDEFRPERFVDQPPDSATWLPFGGGVHRCLGAAFAAVELRTVLREVLCAAEFEPVSADAEPALLRHVTLVPKHGARARIRSRAAEPSP